MHSKKHITRQAFLVLFVVMTITLALAVNLYGQSTQKRGSLESPPEMFVQDEEQASFPGGQRAWSKHLIKHRASLPASCEEGRVYLSFIVRSTGKVDSIQVMRGICDTANENAIEILEKSGLWNPGKLKGKVVDSRLSIQIFYRHRRKVPKQLPPLP